MDSIMDTEIVFNENDYGKIKIIALTGRLGSGLKEIRSHLCKNRNVCELHQVWAGDPYGPSSNEFLEKIVKGDIIEAYCDDDNRIWGTDISQMLSSCIYVGIYTPQQIVNMQESNRIELLPIEIEMEPESRIQHLIGGDRNPELTYKMYDDDEIAKICEDYLKDRKEYDNTVLDDVTCMWFQAVNFENLYQALEDSTFTLKVRMFNATHNCITDLDNFI